MLSQKKRRRKKKKSLVPTIIPTPPLALIPKIVKQKPKLSKSYVQEEREVKTALSVRFKKKDTPSDQSASIDRDLKFFTDHIHSAEFETAEIPIEPSEERTPTSSKTNEPDGLQLASSYIQLEDEGPVKKYPKEKVNFEDDKLLYYPRRDKILWDDDDIVEGSERKPRDEGLCEPRQPQINQKNKTQFINRFLEEGSYAGWINIKKPIEIIGLENCIQEGMFYRSISTKEFKPIRYTPEKVESLISDLDSKVLKIYISDVSFDKHPAYHEEYNLAKMVESLFGQYMSRTREGITEGLRKRVESIRYLILNTEDDLKLKKLKQDLKDFRRQLHREEITDRELIKSLLEQWKRLKDLREKQEFNTTSVRLLIKTQESDPSQDQQKWDTEFSVELHEILNEYLEKYQENRRQKERLNSSDTNEDFEEIKQLTRLDMDEIREKLTKIYQDSRRPPGEPILFFELERIAITNQKSFDKIGILFYSFEILFDGQKVSGTRNYPFGNINLDCILAIKLTRKIPEVIKLVIYEEQRLRPKHRIVELIIPVPHRFDLFQESPKVFMTFASHQADISGKIAIKIGWSDVDDQDRTYDQSKRDQFQDKTNEQIQKWYEDHLLDPMDPEVNNLVDSIRKTDHTSDGRKSRSQNLFRLNEDLTAFCSEAELKQNKRLNMLIARFNNDLQLKNQIVPHAEREIPDLNEEDMRIIEELGWMDPIDVQRHRGRKYLRNIYRIMTNHFESMTESYDSQDLLIGDTPPTFSSLLSALGQLFGPKRPLNPQRRSTTTVRKTFKPAQLTNLKLIVNVIRATGIPMRIGQDQGQSARSNSEGSQVPFAPQRLNNVMPFVAATFKDKSVRTTTAEGSNPTWNEQLTLPLSGNIIRGEMRETLCIQLFDETITDMLDDPRSRETEIYQRIDKKWIGELRIPFSTIYTTQRIEGTFELTSPNILLGYVKPSVTSSISSTFIDNILEPRNSIHLTVVVILEPKIEIPHLTTSRLECTELTDIQNRIQIWCSEFRVEFPHRCRYPLVSLSNGKRICITRLVGAIDIPFQRTDASEQLIRRFVALIPVLQTGDFCANLEGVWLTNDQIISILSASGKDLGVLLACYYISLGFNAFLVFGHTLLNGETTFVLTREGVDFYLIDPLTGKKYSSKDTFCPLVKVYCLINGENIWANFQKEDRVFLTRFDVTQSSDWLPLFNKSIRAPIGLVHNNQLEYRNSDDITELKRIIEQKIMKKISVWRDNRRTTWNRNLSETLRQFLVQFEEDMCFEYQKKINLDKLGGVLTTYKCTGFPINMRYTSLSRIVDRVKSTGIHLNLENRVEFSVGIHIQPYPNNILSVWIFLLSLVPKTIGF